MAGGGGVSSIGETVSRMLGGGDASQQVSLRVEDWVLKNAYVTDVAMLT